MKFKPYPEYKDSRVQWIGKIPEEWEVHRIKSFVPYIKNGQWGDDSSGGNNDFIVLRVADFLEFNFNLDKELTIRNINDTKLRLKEGDLVIEKSGGGEKQIVGRVVQLKNSSKDKKYTYSNFIGKLEISNKMNKTFLNYYFKTFYNNRVTFNYIKQTTGIQNLDSTSLIQREYFAFPTNKNYQKSIVSFLDKKIAELDELIEKDKKLIELLKEKRTALINHAVTKGLDLNVKMKESGIEWIGEIPEGWKTSRLRFLGDSIIGLTYSPNDIIEEGSNSNLILRSSNIQNNKLSLHDNIYVNKKIPKKLITKKGDILICSRNGSRELIGKNIYIDDRTKGCSFGAFMMVYRTKYWRFMSLFFNSQVFKSQSGLFLTTTINQLTIGTLNNFYVAIPSNIEEQLAIASFLDKFTARTDKTIQKIQKKIKLLEEYKKSLIHHTVTGKIDIREVKI